MFSGDYEIDNLIMTDILDNIKFYSGSTRRKMLTTNGIKHPKDGGSMLYGLTWRSYLKPGLNREQDPVSKMYKTKIMVEHPELKEIFDEFKDFHFPDFDYGSVQMNKNFECPRHIDGSKYYHYVEPFEGTRYSLVFFHNRSSI